MKTINVQLQPERYPEIDKDKIVSIAQEFSQNVEVSESEDNGIFINIQLKVNSVSATWKSIQSQLMNCKGFKEAAIVVCEGASGWKDYYLLHHFDSTEKLDKLP